MSKQIKNQKKEIPTGIELNDKDYLNSLLSNLKELEKNYAVALTEASNQTLYQEYKTMFDKYSSLQREVYELMFKNGWYILEAEEKQKIDSKYKTLNQEFLDLEN